MRNAVFLDTSYLLALILKKDARHREALAAVTTYTGRFVTTDLVLVEFANSLSMPMLRTVVISAVEKIRSDSATTVISFTPEGFEQALELFKNRHDKSWGLIDCFSFVVMKEKRIRMALTFDDHFRQAEFETPLLKD